MLNPRYEKLTQEFIQNMEAVDAPFEDFVLALHDAVVELHDRHQCAKDELKANQREQQEVATD